MAKKKNVENENKKDVKMPKIAIIFVRISLSIAIVCASLILIMNTFVTVTNISTISKAKKDNKLESAITEIYTFDDTGLKGALNQIVYPKYYEAQLTEDIKTGEFNNIAARRIIELIELEVTSVLIILGLNSLYKFLSNKNMEDPYSEKSSKHIINMIMFMCYALGVSALMEILGSILLTVNNSSLEFNSIGLIDLGSYLSIIMGTFIFKYIIDFGRSKIKQKD